MGVDKEDTGDGELAHAMYFCKHLCAWRVQGHSVRSLPSSGTEQYYQQVGWGTVEQQEAHRQLSQQQQQALELVCLLMQKERGWVRLMSGRGEGPQMARKAQMGVGRVYRQWARNHADTF